MSDPNDLTHLYSNALVVNHGGRDYVVPADFHGLFAIGRGATCQITLASKTVSRLHGCIRVTENAYFYRDMSSNGTTLVNGHDETLVQDAEVLLPKTGLLRIGDQLLRFHRREA